MERLKGPVNIKFVIFILTLRKAWASSRLENRELCQERKTNQKLKALEELCGAQLSQGQRLDFVVWSHYAANDLRSSACQFQEIEQKMKGYTDNIFTNACFIRVNQFFSGKHIALSHEDGEMLVLLLSLSPIGSSRFILWYLRLWGEIGNLTAQLIQEMKSTEVIRGLYRGPVTYGRKFVDRSIFYRLHSSRQSIVPT